jgi:hypothetical protein
MRASTHSFMGSGNEIVIVAMGFSCVPAMIRNFVKNSYGGQAPLVRPDGSSPDASLRCRRVAAILSPVFQGSEAAVLVASTCRRHLAKAGRDAIRRDTACVAACDIVHVAAWAGGEGAACCGTY